ncbi:hypothetical protein P5673_028413 [Acropora cervicornis]|uniref:Uncharacterized protein n=1 Tax=Acropora cervicornis TaxID=6130 RepID=A0AAD9UV76_ACRCE|nr:hypothetical protein P5673_028413 [Acropora cervicornis]
MHWEKNYISGAKTKGQKTSPPERQIPMCGLKLSQVKLNDYKGGTHLHAWENESFETLQAEDNHTLNKYCFYWTNFVVP